MALSIHTLEALGFSSFFRQQSLALVVDTPGADLVCARVAVEHRGAYDLESEAGPLAGFIPGSLRHRAHDQLDLPAVGDWVVVDPATGLIAHVLERRTHFVRQRAGRRTEPQVIAANIDTAFVVCSATQEFNPRRLERYRMAIARGGAEVVFVLNKADLCSPAELAELSARLPSGTPSVTISALAADGLGQLGPWVRRSSNECKFRPPSCFRTNVSSVRTLATSRAIQHSKT